MSNLDSALQSRDITLPTKVHIVKAVIFLVIMYECESWTVKETKSWRIVTFELWCWRRHFRVPWTTRRSNQSILKKPILNIHWKDWCWSLSSSTMATWCEEPTHWERPWCWEKLKAGGEGDNRGRDGRMASLTQWTWVWGNSGRQQWQITLVCCSSWDHRVGHDLATEQQQQQYYLREIVLIFLLLQLPYHKTDRNNALWNTQMQMIPHKYKGLIFKGRGANMKRKMKTAAQRNTSL